jgi:uncharacterized protein
MAKYPLTLLILFAFAAAPSLAVEPSPKKLILITQSKGFVHDVVKRGKNGEPCQVETIFKALAEKTKLFTVIESSQDASILTPEKLKSADIVVFYTTGDLPMKPEDLDAWVKAGGLFMGIHPATDTFHGNACYCQIIGGEFVAHPWNANTTVTIKVLDPDHGAAKPWLGASITFPEAFYQHKNFDPAGAHSPFGLNCDKTAF